MTAGLVISAPASGVGKTTLTLALARAYRNRGVRVQCLKSGPDYIDPAFHAVATGRASVNIDSWAMAREAIAHLAGRGADADLVLAEGSMGLFDGVAARGVSGTGATADIAEMMEWPVLLVIDPSGQAQTAAAVAAGLRDFRAGVRLAGVVLNRVASARHEALVRNAMAGAGVPVLGALPRHAEIALPKRHLGLVQAEEQAQIDGLIDEAARFVAEHVDLDAVLRSARVWSPRSAVRSLDITPPGQRIALARDAAFSFVYPHMLEAWRAAGAEIVPFSPLADEGPDPDADVCWLPGGYPELHAGRLAANRRFLAQLRAFTETRPVHGECGGYMVLGAALTDADGVRHEMAGLLGLETSYAKRRMHLGYRLAELAAPMPGRGPGARLRGHEFHYSTIIAQPDTPLAVVRDATGAIVAETGSRRGCATGTFFHLIVEDR
ncbi:cobyrinic acid a,c-diamide synthase [Bradyrhizobium japonicum]|jgi:cobyrinic acid a,c-diamide synthase|uniref:cobyrinate a,c-diamide synthase n=1 Tax=Bradyrhizobium elkanii TaxID=29448 RepID=UPI000376002E|nr:cobyrinate a,c-diamide synthase [Bradyrhizobium elkanii]MCP1730039.1 cobyrinic acid a,c-diamide synthase [Bradyrhizobium elkanii]MCS3574168.1 cobyrinic acid a,c-diamide synthase [Bradyrhizobium elkanii]MCS3593141.1 cobyrinic acid a,c-diamide synthase [Bradyrhizobium elkanii]MCS3622586.1 cobyrinic acid a,c-diamide synthase [Bradyrhizobium elkanii]MCW2108947.1 cobyrinic acid a,c-diamide synthase [Bradyrhizobium elkanii]